MTTCIVGPACAGSRPIKAIASGSEAPTTTLTAEAKRQKQIHVEKATLFHEMVAGTKLLTNSCLYVKTRATYARCFQGQSEMKGWLRDCIFTF